MLFGPTVFCFFFQFFSGASVRRVGDAPEPEIFLKSSASFGEIKVQYLFYFFLKYIQNIPIRIA